MIQMRCNVNSNLPVNPFIKYISCFYGNWNIQAQTPYPWVNRVDWNVYCGTRCAGARNFFLTKELCLPLYAGCNLQVTLVDLPFRLIGNVITSKRCSNEAVVYRYTRIFDIALQLCTLINGCNNSHQINSPLYFAGHYLHMDPRCPFPASFQLH